MESTPPELRELRAEIDSCDDAIADAVAERVALAEEVADVKADRDRDLVDEEREQVVASGYADRFRERGLDPERGEDLAELLIAVALEHERSVDDSS